MAVKLPERRADESETLSQEAFLACLEKNGVFGFGGAGFPTARKIRTFLDSPVNKRMLLINAVECDPGLLHDKWLLRHRMNELAGGIVILQEIIGFESVTLAVHAGDQAVHAGAPDVHKGDQTVHAGKAVVDGVLPGDVRIFRAANRYPAGAERLLIQSVFGDAVSSDGLPASHGVLVLNIQTLLAIHGAVRLGKKADTRFLTVADVDGGHGSVVKVRLGMRMSDVVEGVRQKSPLLSQSLNPVRLFAGGGMMQAWHADEADLVGETVNFVGSGGCRGSRNPRSARVADGVSRFARHSFRWPIWCGLPRKTVQRNWQRFILSAVWLAAAAVWRVSPVSTWLDTCGRCKSAGHPKLVF